jgi:hypothetical protein
MYLFACFLLCYESQHMYHSSYLHTLENINKLLLRVKGKTKIGRL